MIVPVIFSLNPVSKERMYTWVFIKAVSFAKKWHWPVIAQKQYFDDIENMKGFCSDNLLEYFEYEIIGKCDLEKIVSIVIPKEIETEYIKRFPSQTDAYLSSVRNTWEEMENFFDQTIDTLEQTVGEKIEAFYVLPNNAFLENVAAKKNIPIIHFEWGPFRPMVYRKTAYFDFDNIVLGLRKRYEKFIQNGEDIKVPIFTRQEILALFLEKEYLQYASENRKPSYELGVATGYSTIGEYSAYNLVSLVELHSKVAGKFSEDDVCWRMHPEDPLHAQLAVKNKSQHKTTVDFILDCKRVLSLSSNMIYEAMLFDRIGYDIGFSHYSFQGNDTLDTLEDKKPDIRFLNFVAFAYLIPYEVLDNPDYIRFRLSRPSETDIYRYHLNYYFDRLNLKYEIIDEKDRLQAILKGRGYVENTEMVCLKRKIEEMEKQQVVLQNKIEKLTHRAENEMRMAILYIDMGEGFTEKNKLFAQYVAVDGEFQAEFDIPTGCLGIRYDPCECGEKPFYFHDLKINGKENSYEAFNIQKVGEKETFIKRNPYFVLKDVEEKIKITIKVDVL